MNIGKTDSKSPIEVQRVAPDKKHASRLVKLITRALFNDPRWIYLVPEEGKRPKVSTGGYTPHLTR
jgi:hypothetical protein